MLILAGVSLNALVGDNGIITNSMNAKVQSGVVALEEYLQEKYVEYYDEAVNYDSKVEFLNTKISNLLLKDGKNNYIVKGGQAYYLLNKAGANLPQDIKDGLVGGDASDRLQYIRMQDVYGITNDLKVYYCDGESNVTLGEMIGSAIDPNSPSVEVNKNTKLGTAVTDQLAARGITVNNTKSETAGNVASLPTLTIDGNNEKYKLENLNGIEELTALRELTLIKQNLSNLDGIENCIYLEYIYFDDCTVGDYSKLATAWNLSKLYINIPASTGGLTSRSEIDSNNEIARLSAAMANATKISGLQYLGIFGWKAYTSEGGNIDYNNIYRNNLSSIDGLASWASNIKSTVIFLYLNNNNLNSVSCLTGYSALYEVYLFTNSNLTSIESLANHASLKYLTIQNCNISSIRSLATCTNLYYLSAFNNSSLTSLDGISTLSKLVALRAYSCNLTDITALKGASNNGLAKLTYLQLEDNSNLEHADSITLCSLIDNMYLRGCDSVLDNDIKLLFPVVKRCGRNYSLPDGKEDLFDYPTTLNYTYSATRCLTDTHSDMSKIKGNTELTWLRLYNQNGLGSSRIGTLLQNGDLAYSELATIKTNLKLDAGGQEALLLDYYIGLGEEGIEGLSSDVIEAKEGLSDLYFRYVLSTCTNLVQLSVYGITNLTKIDFFNKYNSIFIFDMRETHVTDLKPLSWNTIPDTLGTLWIDGNYGKIKFSDCEEIFIRRNWNNKIILSDESVVVKGYEGRIYNGLCLSGNLNNFDFSDCSHFTSIGINGFGPSYSGTLDMRACTGITSIDISCRVPIKLPANQFEYMCFDVSPSLLIFSEGTSIGRLLYDTAIEVPNSLATVSIRKLTKDDGASDLDEIAKLTGSYGTITEMQLRYGCRGNWSGLNNFTALTYVYAYVEDWRKSQTYVATVSNFSGLNNSHITRFEFFGYDIDDVSDITGLPNVRTLDLHKNLLNNNSNLIKFTELSQLQTLNISDNSIEDLAWLDGFVHEKEDGTSYTNLKSLDLSNNVLLESDSSAGTDNAAKVQMLRDLGCTVITTGTNIGI